MRFLFLTVFVFCILVFPVEAQDQFLTVDLAQNHVDITTGFDGAQLILFGVQEQKGDVVVVMTGPKRDVLVRQKKKFFGIWTNLGGIKFKDVPGFYDYAVATEESAIDSSDFLKEAGIGIHAFHFLPKKDYKNKEKLKSFQEALIRNMQKKGMFPRAPEELIFLNDHFFRTTLNLPSNVPIGLYMIQTFLMRDGKVIDVKETSVKVAQVGVNSRIYRFAHGHSLAYGMLCVIFAMMMGWLSNIVRRR